VCGHSEDVQCNLCNWSVLDTDVTDRQIRVGKTLRANGSQKVNYVLHKMMEKRRRINLNYHVHDHDNTLPVDKENDWKLLEQIYDVLKIPLDSLTDKLKDPCNYGVFLKFVQNDLFKGYNTLVLRRFDCFVIH